MKRGILHILMAGVIALLAHSCAQEDIPASTDSRSDTGKVTIRFTLDLGEQGMVSRAAWGTETEGTEENPASDNRVKGTAAENNIDISKFNVFVYACKGTGTNQTPYSFIGSVKSEGLKLEEVTEDKSKWTLLAELDIDESYIENKNLQCKIMVVANANVATNDDGSLDTDATFNLADVEGNIPMWGVTTETIILNQQLRTYLKNPIYMLRAMAKIEVELGDDVDDNYVIMGATLNKYNTQGYLLPSVPTDPANSTYFTVGNTTAFDTENCINALSPTVSPDDGLAFTVATDKKSCVIYVPEYSADTQDLTIKLQIATKDAPTTSISSELGKSGGAFTLDRTAIVRNHWYKCTVNSIDYNTGFDLTLTVAPWTDVEEKLDYKGEVSIADGQWTNYSSKEDNTIELKVRTSESDDTDVTAVYSFNLDGPLTMQWMAWIDEDTDGKFEFDMDNTSGNGTDSNEGAIQRTVTGELLVTGSSLKLGVKAIDPTEKGVFTAKLRLVVMYGGKTIEVDLVDGENNTLDVFEIMHSKL